MANVNIYLTFNGNCEAAFEFYKSVLGGEFTMVNRFSEMPPQKGMPPMPEEMANRIMHVTLPVGEHTVLMGSDTGGAWAENFKAGNNFSVSFDTTSREEAERVYAGLSAGGNPTMPLADTFWGSYFGQLIDKFGISWMISCNQQ